MLIVGMTRFPIRSLSSLSLALALGCGQDEIQVYRVAKSAESAPTATAMPAGHPPISESASPPAAELEIAWKVPPGWRELPASGMRRASFKIGAEAELSVVSLPGDAGGELSNVNRWRSQIGLEPLTPDRLAAESQRLSCPAGPLLKVDFSAQEGAVRVAGAILSRPGVTWFFKLTGPGSAVEDAIPAFRDFLMSLSVRKA